MGGGVQDRLEFFCHPSHVVMMIPMMHLADTISHVRPNAINFLSTNVRLLIIYYIRYNNNLPRLPSDCLPQDCPSRQFYIVDYNPTKAAVHK